MFEWLRSQNDFMMIFIILLAGIITWILIFCLFVFYEDLKYQTIRKRKIAHRKNELYRKYGKGEIRIHKSGTVQRSARR